MFIEQISCFKCDKEAVSTTKLCTMCQEKEPKEEPREKVTVRELMDMVTRICGMAREADRFDIDSETGFFEKIKCVTRINDEFAILKQKLEYLVSLQEK